MTMRYPHDHENDVIYFGKTNFRNQMRKFGIKTDDRRRHMYIIGKTGMGKSALLENMILADIYAGHGCCYIDPHGDTAEKLIDYIPSWRASDVVYFNPADANHPIAFNVLEKDHDADGIADYNSKVMSGLLSTFKKVWENVWSARMEYILQNTILALLDTPGTTLLGVNRMLSDKDYRTDIIKNVKDPVVKQFWLKEFAQYDAKFASEAVAPIQNKVGQFLTSTIMRNIVAQPKSSIDIRRIMDDQKIFIVNLSKGHIGEDAMRILGGMLITKIQMAAMERVNIPESERNDFYLYVDEFQNFAVESFAGILSEARKYRLNLIMAHQYIAQLTQTTEAVRDAVFGNVGSMILFRVGAPDAEFLETELMPRFTPEDLINLPKYSIYLKLMIDGITSQPFSAQTLAPIAQRTGSAEQVIRESRERYTGNRMQIEQTVADWSGFSEETNVEEVLAKVAADKKEAKKAKYSHEYQCTRCGKTFTLPVELDRSRPIYCEECHPIVMEERKKGKDKKESRERKQEVKKPAPMPKVAEGDVVARVADTTLSLRALQPPAPEKQSAPRAAPPQPPAADDRASHAPRAADMLRPDDDVAMVSAQKEMHAMPTIDKPSPAVAEEGEAKTRKRKRRRRKRGSGGQGGAASSGEAAASPASSGATVTPLLPGERVTFDDDV